jgi:hypothetical protein
MFVDFELVTWSIVHLCLRSIPVVSSVNGPCSALFGLLVHRLMQCYTVQYCHVFNYELNKSDEFSFYATPTQTRQFVVLFLF